MGWQSKEKTNYLKEFFLHKWSINAGLGSVAAGVFLSIPFGAVAFLPVVGYAAGMGIATLFVPGSSRFRDKIDRQKAAEQREGARQHLMDEISKRVGYDHQYWQVYNRLCERRDSLRKLAQERETSISMEDVDALDDLTIDYLGRWLARIAIHERSQLVDERGLANRVRDIDKQLENVGSEADERRLLKAKHELKALLKRRQEMMTREASLEASMLSMADTFDEVFQRVMSNPTGTDRNEVRVAVERMNAEEELDFVLEEEVEGLLEL